MHHKLWTYHVIIPHNSSVCMSAVFVLLFCLLGCLWIEGREGEYGNTQCIIMLVTLPTGAVLYIFWK